MMLRPSPAHRARLTAAGAAVLLLVVTLSLSAGAAGPNAPPAQPAPTKVTAEEGVRWADLSAAQQSALRPLERDWPRIDAQRKQKWQEVSLRFPKMSTEERSRIQARMAEWAKLTPQERGQARLNYQEAKQVPAQDRQARWESYQALPAERKRQLAARATPASAASATAASAEASRKPAPVPATSSPSRADRGDRAARDTSQAKSNIVPNPAFAAPPKQVAPTVVRASPGATTTLISKRPTPPSHQQTGLPKIAATPEFVDKTTLLPRRGPQAAATRSAKASEAEPARRQ